MPEGDTVWLTARHLHQALAGEVLTRSDFRVPRYATVDLRGQLVTEAHLKMDGSWRVSPADKRLSESYKIRIVLANQRSQAVGYLLGITEVLPTEKEDQVVGRRAGDGLPGRDPVPAGHRPRAAGRFRDQPDRAGEPWAPAA